MAELNFCRHVLEDGFNVKAYKLSEKLAIKKIIEDEIIRHTSEAKNLKNTGSGTSTNDGQLVKVMIQRPITFNITSRMESQLEK